MRAGLQGKLDTSHMAAHINSVHGGQEDGAKFVMKKVKSYPSTFLIPQNLGRMYPHKVQIRGGGSRGHEPKVWRLWSLFTAKVISPQ